jgi:hypothetical protein
MSTLGINLWPMVTLVTLFKYDIDGLCGVSKVYISATRWPISLVPAVKGRQQKGALVSNTENFYLRHPFMADGDASNTF